MKKPFVLILVIGICTLSLLRVQAQSINKERMNSDLANAGYILHDLFRTSWERQRNATNINPSSFYFGRSDKVAGNYLQGYGVILTIPGNPPAFIIKKDLYGNSSNFHFKYGSGKDKDITEETIKKRMKEFLRDYGLTIGQLKDDDRITVVYQNNRPERLAFIRTFSLPDSEAEQASDSPRLPSTIYVTTKEADLKAFKRQSIGEKQFYDRLTIKTTQNDDQEKRDLKIMANILKTTFGETKRDAFQIRGSVNDLHIKDLGAVFYLDVSYGSGLFTFDNAMAAIRKKLSIIAKTDSAEVAFLNKNAKNGTQKLFFNKDSTNAIPNKKEKTGAYKQFLQQLKETIVNYGRTLSSVQSDERVYVSVSFSSVGKGVPDRVDLQIKKSVLERMDRGQISRDEAVNQVKDRAIWFYPKAQSF